MNNLLFRPFMSKILTSHKSLSFVTIFPSCAFLLLFRVLYEQRMFFINFLCVGVYVYFAGDRISQRLTKLGVDGKADEMEMKSLSPSEPQSQGV